MIKKMKKKTMTIIISNKDSILFVTYFMHPFWKCW